MNLNLSRIALSLILIVGAGGAIVNGTSAFFSDTETSQGNTFTAGAIDLKVDHTLQTYNGNLIGGSLTVVSDAQTQVNAHNAIPLTFVHAGWTASIPGATWIWETDGPTDPTIDQPFTFTRTFNWSGPATAATLQVAADNFYQVSLNGNPVGGELANENNFQAGTQDSYNVLAFLTPGVNTLTFTVTNKGVPGSNGQSNPAGLLFKLTIDGPATTWTEKDLASGDVFWNFDDVKPGDSGTNVISLHVYDNDAYACLMATNVEDNENSNIEPEQSAGDTDTPAGELSPFLKLFVWNDGLAGDGVYTVGETIIYGPNQPLSGFGTAQKIALQATTTQYVGTAWCFGEQSVDGGGTISCDGSADGYNVAQTDSVVADLEFLAVQQRNNASFQCPMPEEPEHPNTSLLHATKIECEAESSLPNWGNKGIAQVTSTTATDFVNSHPGCKIVPWDFQWSLSNADPDDHLADAGAGWATFSSNVPAEIPVGGTVYVREVFKQGYIGFTGQNTDQNVSAELYCSTDVMNYDNWEWVPTAEAGADYYCVAFNVPTEVPVGPTLQSL
jgi:predicted ribosomally synthesized peptide with SipW-like signal peptide